jgi:7-cyano-7-deazaguanine synthase in queuosine biosynthesis
MTKIINTKTGDNLRLKRTEDPTVLEKIEEIFKLRRCKIIKFPGQGTPVVVVHSGGMDSTINMAILMEEFGLKIYPLFINRGQTNLKWEKASVDFFDDYFSKKYPELYNKSFEIKINIPPDEYKDELRATRDLQDNLQMRTRIAFPSRNPAMILMAAEYAYSMQSKGIFPKTIFTSFMNDDPPRHSTLTAIRMMNLITCQIMGDYNWQIISIPLERELDNYYGKDYYLNWAVEHNLPIEKTRSCYRDQPEHCGTCFPACQNRKAAFKRAGILDKTIYKS